MDIIYYNILANSTKSNDDTGTYYFQYIENRDRPLLGEDYKQYLMNIERIQLCISTLPLFIPTISSGNTTVYGVQMSYNGTQSSVNYCTYTCNNKYVSNPSDPRYYYIYSIKHIVDMLNSGIQACYTEIGNVSYLCPYFFYDGGDTIYLYIDDNFVNNEGKLSFNNAFFNLIYTFPNVYNSSSSLFDLDLSVKYIQSQSINGHNIYVIIPDDSPLQNWSPISNLVVVSNGSNFREEILGGVYTTNLMNQTTSYFQPDYQILDICLLGTPQVYNGNIVYIPTNPRMINIKDSVKNINIQLKWRNKFTGVLNDIEMNSGDYFSMKLKFTKEIL